MKITKNAAKYEYKCNFCGADYTEQRHLNEPQFFTTCQISGCNGNFELVNTTELTYEQEIPEPEVTE